MDTEAEHFRSEFSDGVAYGVFNRPRSLNAFSTQMRGQIVDFLIAVENDSATRCVVLKGAGENFMAGGDIRDFTYQMEKPAAERRTHFEAACHAMHPIIYRMRRLRTPVIASVKGACAGLGLSLVLGSDLAICADDAFFTLAYTKIGTTPDGGASYFLPRTVGMKRAMEIALLSERFDADTAERYGIVNWVVPKQDLDRETDLLSRRLAKGATGAMGRAKSLLNGSLSHDLEAQLQAEAVSFGICSGTDEMAEGVSAFIEKREPGFVGD